MDGGWFWGEIVLCHEMLKVCKWVNTRWWKIGRISRPLSEDRLFVKQPSPTNLSFGRKGEDRPWYLYAGWKNQERLDLVWCLRPTTLNKISVPLIYLLNQYQFCLIRVMLTVRSSALLHKNKSTWFTQRPCLQPWTCHLGVPWRLLPWPANIFLLPLLRLFFSGIGLNNPCTDDSTADEGRYEASVTMGGILTLYRLY